MPKNPQQLHKSAIQWLMRYWEKGHVKRRQNILHIYPRLCIVEFIMISMFSIIPSGQEMESYGVFIFFHVWTTLRIFHSILHYFIFLSFQYEIDVQFEVVCLVGHI